MLYLIGLGLNEKGISLEGLEAIQNCDKIYLENYTVDFPYNVSKLKKIIKKKIIKLLRKEVESQKLLNEAKNDNIALLIYGSPLFATTHITLIKDAKKQNVNVKVIYSASVFDSVAETGLQLYKFGKITSIPKWEKNFEPDSFIEIIKENKKINAHSLILVDIGLGLNKCLEQLETVIKKNSELNISKIIIASRLGNNKSLIYYSEIEKLKKLKISHPYCLIIPGKLHFLEEKVLNEYLLT
jgi:diphthine synthase